jgi:tripartite-type tricarboxylate transporter receptor subunit TctC
MYWTSTHLASKLAVISAQERGEAMRLGQLVMTAACVALTAMGARAEEWPVRSIHAVVPFGAGTTTDMVPRIVFEQLSTQLGQSIIVENRPGAGTTTGTAAVAKAAADGYTMLVNSSAHTIAPSLYPSLGYDVSVDFAAVAPLGVVPSVLIAPRARGFKTAADLVATARAKPGSLNFASAGVGTATHLSAIRFNVSAGITSVHVPFKAAPEILGEMVAGRIDYFLAPIAVALPFIREGKIAALAVNSPSRIASLPEVPTLTEEGFANAEYSFWIGLFLPARTPRPIVDKLARETLRALAEPVVKERLAAQGIGAMEKTPAEFDTFVKSQIVADAELVRAAGLNSQQGR